MAVQSRVARGLRGHVGARDAGAARAAANAGRATTSPGPGASHLRTPAVPPALPPTPPAPPRPPAPAAPPACPPVPPALPPTPPPAFPPMPAPPRRQGAAAAADLAAGPGQDLPPFADTAVGRLRGITRAARCARQQHRQGADHRSPFARSQSVQSHNVFTQARDVPPSFHETQAGRAVAASGATDIRRPPDSRAVPASSLRPALSRPTQRNLNQTRPVVGRQVSGPDARAISPSRNQPWRGATSALVE